MIRQLHQLRPYVFQGDYTQVAPTGRVCITRRCYRKNEADLPRSSCEALCDSFVWCVGYMHYKCATLPCRSSCSLITLQEDPCPSEYTYKDEPVLTSIDDLDTGRVGSSTGCYITGKTKAGLNTSCTIYLYNVAPLVYY